MRVISRARLREFWKKHADAEDSLKAWCAEAETSHWRKPSDIKAEYPSASFIAGNRVVYNIQGNRYRLIVAIKYEFEIVYIRFVGTHAEYDKVDATKV
jgi:mRNA interferase HigB